MGATEGETALNRAVLRAIDKAGGWIPFDEFMRMSLHEPGLGYYSRANVPLGATGDFVTAPEISDLYSRALARFVAAALPVDGALLEVGGGSGRLMRVLLTQLARMGVNPSCLALETNPALATLQQEELETHGFSGRMSVVGAVPRNFRGVVVLNEVLDSLPCKVVAKRGGKWVERGVGTTGDRTLTWADGPNAEAGVTARLEPLVLPDGYQAEVNLQAEALVATLVESIDEGVVLIVDYGFPRHEMYHPQRSQGTLMSHFGHRAGVYVLSRPGQQDITAHVDFTAMAEAAMDAGGKVAGYTTQSAFLLGLGITELAQDAKGARELASASRELQTLLMPHEMGELFKVMAITCGKVRKILPGFADADKSHTLWRDNG